MSVINFLDMTSNVIFLSWLSVLALDQTTLFHDLVNLPSAGQIHFRVL